MEPAPLPHHTGIPRLGSAVLQFRSRPADGLFESPEQLIVEQRQRGELPQFMSTW